MMKTPRKKFKAALDLSLYTLRLTKHAQRMADDKGFTKTMIESTYKGPKRVYPSGSHPGQWRITGNGICLVGIPDSDADGKALYPLSNNSSHAFYSSQSSSPSSSSSLEEGREFISRPDATRYFTVITIYQDEILTPPRDDQLNTPEGRRYAERYLRGDGRG
jgi:hypothetical protein